MNNLFGRVGIFEKGSIYSLIEKRLLFQTVFIIIVLLLFANCCGSTEVSMSKFSDKAEYFINETADYSLEICNPSKGDGVIIDIYEEMPDGNMVLNYNGVLIESQLYLEPLECWSSNVSYTVNKSDIAPDGKIWNWLYIEGMTDFEEPVNVQVSNSAIVIDPPASVENMRNSTGNFWINWTWTNPDDIDFFNTMIYIDGEHSTNTSQSYYVGFYGPHETHTISTRTVDWTLNVNLSWVNQTSTIPNNPPSINMVLKEENPANVTVEVIASDFDGDILTYSCNRTDLFDFNISTGKGIWVFEPGVNGTFLVDFGVSDGYGGLDNLTVLFLVKDVVPPPSVSDLNITMVGMDYINWTWTPPVEIDFSNALVYLNSQYMGEADSFYNATGLKPCTEYTVSVLTVDNFGNVNLSWVNGSAMTLCSQIIAEFMYTPNPVTGQKIIFNASKSRSSNSYLNIIEYLWDFEDGVKENRTDPVINHSFSAEGIYNVSLTVKDDLGRQNTTIKQLTVSEKKDAQGEGRGGGGGGNSPIIRPEVGFDFYPEDPEMGEVVTFNASISSWKVLEFSWDFGDGNSMLNGEEVVNHIFNSSGVYEVILTGYDISGISNSTSKLVKVGEKTMLNFSPPTPGNNSVIDEEGLKIVVKSNKPLKGVDLVLNGINFIMSGNGTEWYLNYSGVGKGTYTIQALADNTSTEKRQISVVGNETETTEPSPGLVDVIVLEKIKEVEEVQEATNQTSFVKFKSDTVVEKVLLEFEHGNLTGYRITHWVNVLEGNDPNSTLWVIFNVSKDIAYDVGQIFLPEGVVVIESDPIIGIEIKGEEGEEGELHASVATDVDENEFIKGIEISHKLVVEEEHKSEESHGSVEEDDRAGLLGSLPTTQIIVILAGVMSAVVIYVAMRKKPV